MSLYEYVRSNPINHLDPDGLQAYKPPLGGISSGLHPIPIHPPQRLQPPTDWEQEREEIIEEARRWNWSSPGWAWGNQCNEQSEALQERLRTRRYKHWKFSVIGGYKGWKGELLGIKFGCCIQHNIVQVDSRGSHPGEPFTLDPFKLPVLPNPTKGVTVGTPKDFKDRFPKSLD